MNPPATTGGAQEDSDWSPSKELFDVLIESQRRGLIGALIPMASQVEHARRFGVAWSDPPARMVDLGSGGGLPGLVLAEWWPLSKWLLVDAQQKRTDFLAWAVRRLGWDERVTVAHARAEDLARGEHYRHRFDGVVARSFGPPAAVAECATGFLGVGGRLVVSEPPADAEDRVSVNRWDHDKELATLGLERTMRIYDGGYQILEQQRLCPESRPRKAGVPRKRPLF